MPTPHPHPHPPPQRPGGPLLYDGAVRFAPKSLTPISYALGFYKQATLHGKKGITLGAVNGTASGER